MADGAVFDHATNLFVFNGIPMLQGRAPGTYFTFAHSRPQVGMQVGIDGQGFFNKIRDLSATMTLVVMPNSEDNDVLDAALQLFMATPGGVRFPLLVKQGLTLKAGFGVPLGWANVEFSDGPMLRSWTVGSTKMVGKVGGQSAAPLAPPS